METRGRRPPRAPITAAPAEPPQPVEVPAIPAAPPDAPREPSQPAETLAQAAPPTESALDRGATAAPSLSQPSANAATTVAKSTPPDDFAYFSRDAFAALAQSHAALTRGLEALSAEMAGLARSGIDTASRTAAKMLGVKTLSDALEVNAGFTCSSFDTLVSGSAKLSELGVKLAAEAARPILTQFGKGWVNPSRLGSWAGRS